MGRAPTLREEARFCTRGSSFSMQRRSSARAPPADDIASAARGSRLRSFAGLERLGALQIVLAGVEHQVPAVVAAHELAAREGHGDLLVTDAELAVDADE